MAELGNSSKVRAEDSTEVILRRSGMMLKLEVCGCSSMLVSVCGSDVVSWTSDLFVPVAGNFSWPTQ